MNDQHHPDEPDLSLIKPCFFPSSVPEPPRIASIVKTLGLESHIEGGYFKQTDVSVTTMPSPYPLEPLSQETVSLMGGLHFDYEPLIRKLSTTIYYYLTPSRPQGHFHRNRSRIIHSLHRGRGRYVLIYPDGRIESFVVGHNIEQGERLQWIVEGGVWKASYLLDTDDENDGLLISETVVPGFEYADHEFLSEKGAGDLLSKENARELGWLVRKQEAAAANGKTESTTPESTSHESDTKDDHEFNQNYELHCGTRHNRLQNGVSGNKRTSASNHCAEDEAVVGVNREEAAGNEFGSANMRIQATV